LRSVLSASVIMGLSSVISVALSIVRQKVIAVVLGPEGIGVLGLLSTALNLGTIMFSLGLASSGVRYVARAREESEDGLALARSSLLYGSQLLGLLAAIVFIVFRAPIADVILGGSGSSKWILWLSLALGASVAAGGQLAAINGLSRISALAAVNIWGAGLSTVATVVAIAVSADAGLVTAIVAPPLAIWLAASWFSRDIKLLPFWRHLPSLWDSLISIAGLGLVFSAGFALTSLVQFLSRVVVERTLDLEAAGHFQAAWSVSKVYLGFVLSALAAEYYPRISSIANDTAAINRAVVQQVKHALLLAGPIILGMILFAPLVITTLYSGDFGETAVILRLQLAGDVPKIAVWALGFLLLAREARLMFFLAELLWSAFYLGSLVLLLPVFGLIVTGIVYAAAYILSLIVLIWFARTESNLLLDREVLWQLIPLSFVSLLVALLTSIETRVGFILSGVLTALVTVLCLYKIKVESRFSFRRLLNSFAGSNYFADRK
jgi:antigen flippase